MPLLNCKEVEKAQKTKKVGYKFQYVDKFTYFCNLKCRAIEQGTLRTRRKK